MGLRREGGVDSGRAAALAGGRAAFSQEEDGRSWGAPRDTVSPQNATWPVDGSGVNPHPHLRPHLHPPGPSPFENAVVIACCTAPIPCRAAIRWPIICLNLLHSAPEMSIPCSANAGYSTRCSTLHDSRLCCIVRF